MPNPAPHAIAACAIEVTLAGTAVKVLPDGEFRAVDGRPTECAAWRLGSANAAKIIAFSEARKARKPVDYEHATLRAKETGQEAPAAGWWSKLEYRPGDGLYATDVQWTERASQMIRSLEYRYISPVFAYAPQSGDVLALLNFALTNDPALDDLGELALAAASAAYLSPEPHPENPPMEKELLERLRCVLNLPTASTAADISAELTKVQGLIAQMQQEGGQTVGLAQILEQSQARIAALSAQTPDPAKFVPIDVVTGLQTKLADLTARLDGQDVERLVQAGLSDGRILPEMEDWARDLGKINRAALSAYLDKATPIAALTQTQTGGKRPPKTPENPEALSEAELAVCSTLGMSAEEFKKTRNEAQP